MREIQEIQRRLEDADSRKSDVVEVAKEMARQAGAFAEQMVKSHADALARMERILNNHQALVERIVDQRFTETSPEAARLDARIHAPGGAGRPGVAQSSADVAGRHDDEVVEPVTRGQVLAAAGGFSVSDGGAAARKR